MTTKQKQTELDKVAQPILDRKVDIEIAKSCLNPVPGEGSPDAPLMFIGEAPGAQEDKLGRPFVGASGKFLGEMLESIGLTREDVYITNIVKFRPPNNRDPLPNEIEACLPYLVKQMEIISPKLVIFLGRHSLNVFFPELKISQAHGQPVRRTITLGKDQINQVFLPLYHPAAALYNGGMRTVLQEDFAKIPKVLDLVDKK